MTGTAHPSAGQSFTPLNREGSRRVFSLTPVHPITVLAPAGSHRKFMKPAFKRALWGLAFVVIIAALALPKLTTSAADPAGGPGGAPGGGGGGVAVETVRAVAESVTEQIRASGTIRANEEVQLVAEATGRITELLFEEGSRVREGDLLVKINDAELRAQRESVTRRLQLAETAEARRSELLRVGGVSQEEYDQILNQVSVLRAELDLISAQVNRTEIRAPFPGIIGLRHVSPGSYLSPQSPVATLRQVDPIKLEFDVPERFANRVTEGDEVVFTTDASFEEYSARIYAIEPGIDLTTRSLRIRARGSNPEGALRPGEFAQVRVILSAVEGAVMIPSTALRTEGGRNLVFVNRDGVAEQRSVEVGIRTAERVQIVNGLAPGEEVVTRGVQLLREGSPLRVTAP